MKKAEWKVGIIGAGGISAAHIEALAQEPRAQLCAIADLDEAVARSRVNDYGNPAVYRDYQKMLEQEQLDGVIICLPNHLHEQVAIAVLDAGCHVLCEKPLATSADAARRMAEHARRTGKVLMVGQNNRFRADAQLLKRLLTDDRLGDVYHAKAGWIRRNGIPGWGSWFTDRERAGGGPLIDIGVHMLDLTLWLLNFPRPVSVFGQTYARFGPHKKGLSAWGTVMAEGRFDVEDSAVALIRFDNGFTLNLDASWASHIPKERAYVDLLGETAGASLDFYSQRLRLFQEETGIPVDAEMTPGPQHDRLQLLSNWIGVMAGTEQPICTAEQGVEVLRILDAIYTSAQTGQSVSLD
ncbi:Gfo/Idh/MocA family protein [Desmospora activa]|uniref:Putative dehydrogenase n=1 Tax=Desmospora activa DSM 45169 TaxID=1121389 RepID=A0A2T4ZDG9_9BACL|nr:Gfo/Idh/MocA family oxidoreductase [Desmospora activa]PTM59943.1 putative dehydrogenase [Desmospora activa DSM 45169]